MKIIEPNVELWIPKNNISHVARCARVCYGKESGNDERLIENLIKKKHYSMFRHATHYYIIPQVTYTKVYSIIQSHRNRIGFNYYFTDLKGVIVTNGNWNIDYPNVSEILKQYEVTPEEFAKNKLCFNMMRYTFCITTQISTSRELNRVSPNNISEQSTRYVYEDGTICKPWWMDNKEVIKFNNNINNIEGATRCFIDTCEYAFNKYKYLIEEYNMNRQDARGVLPLDTATKCVYTYSIEEWRNIINLRYYGTTGAPHPNAKIIAGMIRNKLIELGYEFEN